MKRSDYDEIEASAHVAMAGLLAGDEGWATNPGHLAGRAFDIAEAFHAEKKNRIGERPDYES